MEFELLMRSLAERRAPVTYEALGNYVLLWRWPESIKCNGSGFAMLFTKDAVNKCLGAMHFNCSASELLSILPVLSLYFRRAGIKYGVLTECIRSMLQCINVVALIQRTRSRRSNVSAAELQDAFIAHLNTFYSVNGNDEARPNHHITMHLTKQYLQWLRLVPCWVHERYHKPKAFASTRRDTTPYELGIAEDITVTLLMAMETTKIIQGCLVDPMPLKGAALQRFVDTDVGKTGCDVLSSQVYSTGLDEISVGDVALWKKGAHIGIDEVHLHYCLDGAAARVVSPFMLGHREGTLQR